MSWYIVVKAFFVVYTTIGPYDSEKECKDTLAAYRVEYAQKYANGERITFLGKSLTPSNVSAYCRLK